VKIGDAGIIAAVIGLPTLFVFLWINDGRGPTQHEARAAASAPLRPACRERGEQKANAAMSVPPPPASAECAKRTRAALVALFEEECVYQDSGNFSVADMTRPCVLLRGVLRDCPRSSLPAVVVGPQLPRMCGWDR
jgi:hypothetical protein